MACVNRRNVTIVHNSAKQGDHLIPDALSRLNKVCDCGNCSVKKFLDEIPAKVELMSITDVNNYMASITNIIWDNCNKEIDSVVASSISKSLLNDVGAIPFGNKKCGNLYSKEIQTVNWR